jgi:5-methyltetrahydrofolate--homocysteine methyltransferase
MLDWKKQLAAKTVLISDGAWGTEFSKRGLGAGESPERWNLDKPDLVLDVARTYVGAGADIILTNSFGGSPVKLEKSGLKNETRAINRRAAELSKQAAAGKALVFASVGPTGEFMAPLGTLTEAEVIAGYADQVKGLVEGGADGIVIETMIDLAEAIAAVKAVRDNSSLPIVACLSFQNGPGGYATIMGVRPQQAAEELTAAGADIVGSNCGTGFKDMIEIARLMRSQTDCVLWFKGNAGLPELIGGKTVFKETPGQMADLLGALVEAGATIIGGCCGTTPDHIRALVNRRDALVKRMA